MTGVLLGDPVIQMALAFFATLLFIALLPSRRRRGDPIRRWSRAVAHSLCTLPLIQATGGFSEMEDSWFQERAAWFSRSMERIQY
jgi:hypothetical protein